MQTRRDRFRRRTDLDVFLKAKNRNFEGCCRCPGCYRDVNTGGVTCDHCQPVEKLYRLTGSPSETARQLRNWLMLPKTRNRLQGTLHTNLFRPAKSFLMEEVMAEAVGQPFSQPPRAVREEFEEGAKCSKKHMAQYGKKKTWFASHAQFSRGLHNSGFVERDIHSSAVPDTNTCIFIPDFSCSSCRVHGCTRPAFIAHLEGRQQYDALLGKPTWQQQGGAMASHHPMLRLTHHEGLCFKPPSQRLQLCIRHADARVNTAILVRMYLCGKDPPPTHPGTRFLPALVGECIAHHVLYG